MEGLWQRAADRIRDSLGQVGYETWIGPLNFLGMQGRIATIEAPNRFFRDWVSDRYLELLRQSLSAEVGQTVDVKLTLGLVGNGILHEGVRRAMPQTPPSIRVSSAAAKSSAAPEVPVSISSTAGR
jgi:chromosomal replication initiator protein